MDGAHVTDTHVTDTDSGEAPPLARSHACVAPIYDRARVEHSRAALELVIRETGLASTATVVDLAAGTGKLTTLLAERFGDVIAIEPEEAMRAYIDGDARPGTAEAIPLPDESADAVFVADAFHWFDAPRALDELARVLRSAGWLVLVWNQWWATDPPLPAAAIALLDKPFQRRLRERAAGVDWRDAFPHAAFEPMHDAEVEDETVLSADALVDLLQTTSSIAALPGDQRDALAAELRALLQGEYRLPMRHTPYWMRRR